MKSEDGTGGRHPSWRCGLSPTYFIEKEEAKLPLFQSEY